MLRPPWDRLWRHVGGWPLKLVVLTAPLALFSDYHLFWLNMLAVHAISALGLNLLVGFSGQVSLGHAGFMAIGAYTCTLAMRAWGLTALPALVLATVLAGVCGLLLGLPSVRLRGPYLAVATLAFGMGVVQLLGHWPLLGGHMGLSVPGFSLLGWQVQGDRWLYGAVAAIAWLAYEAARNLTASRLGRAFCAVRASEAAAAACGIDVVWTRAQAFAVAAAYAGLAGGLLAFVLGYLHPEVFDYYLSVLLLTMVVAGGAGHHGGAVLGAIAVTSLHLFLREPAGLPVIGPALRAFSEAWMSAEGLAYLRYLVVGAILMLVAYVGPRGLVGMLRALRLKVVQRCSLNC